MEIINLKVYGLEESIIRSGYPMQVGKPEILLYSDDKTIYTGEPESKDFDRANKLAKTPSGSGHNNFLKGIIVQFDLRYPEYFSPQLQRYHWIDIVSSQSKMHKITSRELTVEDFTPEVHEDNIENINKCIRAYNELMFKEEQSIWFSRIIANLPSGYMKWMGISTNYLQLKTIYNQRKNHKLREWGEFCSWIETLPLAHLITK